MSNALFPTLPGLKWGIDRNPVWSTSIVRSKSLREYRFGYADLPLYQYRLSYEFLRAGVGLEELQQLVGFFNARHGSFDSFLYDDPSDNAIAGQQFGIGNSSTKKFQLVRSFGAFVEPVYDLKPGSVVRLNGNVLNNGSDYTIDQRGAVQFTVAPALTSVLSWDGGFYRRCRFTRDTAEFSQFMRDLWELRQIEFVSVKP